jgi:hypothetical protein
MDIFFKAYDAFISNFATQYQGIISLGILAILIIILWQLIRKSLIWLFLLVLFVPASIPMLSKIGQGILLLLKYIVARS